MLWLVITSFIHLVSANSAIPEEQQPKQEQTVFVYAEQQHSATDSSPLDVFGLGFSPAAWVAVERTGAEIFSTAVVQASAIDQQTGNCPAVCSGKPRWDDWGHAADNSTQFSTVTSRQSWSTSRQGTTFTTSVIGTKPRTKATNTAIRPKSKQPAIKMNASSSRRNLVLYFTQWAVYGRKHFAADLPADKITHVLYSFANVDGESGKVTIPDSWADTDQRYPPHDKWDDTGKNVYGITKVCLS
jgi:hypothetical protein